MKARMVLGLVIALGLLYGGNVWGFTESGNNNFFGTGAGSATTGIYDTFIGSNAGNSNTTGYYNSFLGYNAGNSNTTGYSNSFFGTWAGFSNTTGNANTFIGMNAGYYNTTGDCNTFLGFQSGTNTTQSGNSFIGCWAGGANTTGSGNSILGSYAGYNNITGESNSFVGSSAGYSNTTGNYNSHLGALAGFFNTTGINNTFIGYQTGFTNMTGSGNIFLGFQAGYSEKGSNRLYISNSNTSSPLIYGEFDNAIATINGRLGILKTPGLSYQLDVNGTVNATSFTGDGSGLTNLTELDPKVGTLTAGKWCSSSDGIHVTCTQNTPLMAEVDPKVGALNSGSWCTSDGTKVNCAQSPPVTVDKVGTLTTGQWCSSPDGSHVTCTQSPPVTTDKVGTNTLNGVPQWNGSQLVSGIIQDNGSNVTVNGTLIIGGGSGSSSPAVGGTVDENDFWLSSGAMYDEVAGQWIQKSSDGKAVLVGLGEKGYRVFTLPGNRVGEPITERKARLHIDYNGNVGLGVTPAHPLHLAGGAYSDGASWINGSSREYKEDIESLSTEEALEAMKELTPVKFAYKADRGQKRVGFIAEDVPELVATKNRKGLSPMDIVAVLTKVVQEKSQLVERQQNTIERLERALEAMEKRLSSLEKQ